MIFLLFEVSVELDLILAKIQKNRAFLKRSILVSILMLPAADAHTIH